MNADSAQHPSGRTGQRKRSALVWMALAAISIAYVALPLGTGAFFVDKFECVPFFGTNLFLYAFAWLGYVGTAIGIAVWMHHPAPRERFHTFTGGCAVALVVFLTMFLPWILEKCHILL